MMQHRVHELDVRDHRAAAPAETADLVLGRVDRTACAPAARHPSFGADVGASSNSTGIWWCTPARARTRLGPLDDSEIEKGLVRCPWHGDSFDVRSGASSDDRGLRLPTPPRLIVDGRTGICLTGLKFAAKAST